MKKTFTAIFSLFLALSLMFSLSVRVFAAGSLTPPVNQGDMPDCYKETTTDQPIYLFANFSVQQGATLKYQWYVSDSDDISTIRAIDYAEKSEYEPPVIEGVKYYCVAAWAVKDGNISAPTYGRMIRVEYYTPVMTVESVELIKAPDKVVYTAGETLDLKGLQVRVLTSDGYVNSVDGKGLNISTKPLVTLGEQKIKVCYGDNTDVFDIFIVTVKAAEHTHSFGEWMITTEPTCTELGIKARECDCGHTERAAIPKTDHTWDKGVEENGEITYTCTVCKTTKTEKLADTLKPTDGTEAPPAATDDPLTESDTNTENNKQQSSFPWWSIIAAVAVATGAGVGVTIFVLKGRNKKNQ